MPDIATMWVNFKTIFSSFPVFLKKQLIYKAKILFYCTEFITYIEVKSMTTVEQCDDKKNILFKFLTFLM